MVPLYPEIISTFYVFIYRSYHRKKSKKNVQMKTTESASHKMIVFYQNTILSFELFHQLVINLINVCLADVKATILATCNVPGNCVYRWKWMTGQTRRYNLPVVWTLPSGKPRNTIIMQGPCAVSYLFLLAIEMLKNQQIKYNYVIDMHDQEYNSRPWCKTTLTCYIK